jgi:hypothetical protein
MKKVLKWSLIFFSLLLTLTLSLGVAIFLRPGIIINPAVLGFVLDRVPMIKQWSWSEAEMNVVWNRWNDRNFSGAFNELCFKLDRDGLLVDSCVSKLSWNFNLTWTRENGLRAISLEPILLRSAETLIARRAGEEQNVTKTEGAPPNIWRYWRILWSEAVPELDLEFSQITYRRQKDDLQFDLVIVKEQRTLSVQALNFELNATPAGFKLIAPTPWQLPWDLRTSRPLHLREVTLKGEVSAEQIPLHLTGSLESADIEITSRIDLPLQEGLGSVAFRRHLLLAARGELNLTNLQGAVARYAPEPYNVLPAPFNVMNGDLRLQIVTRPTEDFEVINIATQAEIDLRSDEQALHFYLKPLLDLNLADFSRSPLRLGLDFQEVRLKLPRLSRRELPPQFRPDPRIKTAYEPMREEEPPKESDKAMLISIEAKGDEALHIISNLLDEALRLNLDLQLQAGELRGQLNVLPLKTTIFRRPINLRGTRVKFNPPLEPELEAEVVFPLPEYKITMRLEGPLSRPRHFLSSEPPLPQADIYAVLLFGRPMQELDPEDRTQANRSQQMLAQGILSLSVLYFFAGSPIEAIGYNPATGGVTAQVGLGRRSALRVGTGEGGGEAGLRHALGGGWYIDTTAGASGAGGGGDYGVLLERIIAY